MHIFLTGEIQVGKSTLIRRVLDTFPNWVMGGFRTITVFDDLPPNGSGVYILPADGSRTSCCTENRIGIRRKGGQKPDAFPGVFETEGLSILESSENCDLLLMDELGVMERNAKVFSQRICTLLNGNVPILGVVKPKHTPLLDAVRQCDNTKILEVTPENRESLFPILRDQMFAAVDKR